jgi:hypothetical protein
MLDVFMLSIFALALAVFAVSAWAILRWRGRWRLLASLPSAVFALFCIWLLVDISQNPTSHNLWPFEVAIWSIAALGILGIMALAKAIISRRVPSSSNGPAI